MRFRSIDSFKAIPPPSRPSTFSKDFLPRQWRCRATPVSHDTTTVTRQYCHMTPRGVILPPPYHTSRCHMTLLSCDTRRCRATGVTFADGIDRLNFRATAQAPHFDTSSMPPVSVHVVVDASAEAPMHAAIAWPGGSGEDTRRG